MKAYRNIGNDPAGRQSMAAANWKEAPMKYVCSAFAMQHIQGRNRRVGDPAIFRWPPTAPSARQASRFTPRRAGRRQTSFLHTAGRDAGRHLMPDDGRRDFLTALNTYPMNIGAYRGNSRPGRALEIAAILAILLAAVPARAMTNNWKASTTGDWADAANWVEGLVPTNGDDAVITNTGASVIISSASSNLNSLTLSRTLTFTNWDTYLQASNISILSNGSMTCVGAFTNNAMSNRVYLICTNLTIAAGGSINVNSKGYAGGYNAAGNGPGKGPIYGAASHGGRGGYYAGSTAPGAINGLTNAPTFAGSGGGGWVSTTGGHGGGAVRIVANDTVTVNGTILADGQDTGGTATSAGSGGSIYITTRLLAGNGTMRARGGLASSTGACGGGGRIAVVYDTATQSTSAVPGIVFSASGNYGTASYLDSDAGTLFFPDNTFLQETFVHSGEWWVDGFTNWAPNNLVVSNGWLRIVGGGFQLSVTNAINVLGNNSSINKLEFSNAVVACASLYVTSAVFRLAPTITTAAVLSCTGNIVLTNGARMYVYAVATNASQPQYGALVSVTGSVAICANAWLYPISHETNGGSVWFQVGNLRVDSGGGINANSLGFMGRFNLPGFGPGGGALYAGGGYGGSGGNYSGSGGGSTYGLSNAPAFPGSAGGGWSGGGGTAGSGGGLIRITANDTITLNGTLAAAGGGTTASATGAGAGGGIYLRCRTFSGNSGTINANAGSASATGGGGGGGRIAIWRMYHTFTSTNVSAALGTSGGAPGSSGAIGTIFWGQTPAPGTIFTMH